MAQAVSGRPLAAKARVRSRVSPCGICGGRSCTGTGFPKAEARVRSQVSPCRICGGLSCIGTVFPKAEARVRSQVSPCGICGGRTCTGTGFPNGDARIRSQVRPCGICVDKVALGQVLPRVLRFSPASFIPPLLHYTQKTEKLITFITRLHNKPQGCGVSVAPAGGPFTTKKEEKGDDDEIFNNCSLFLRKRLW
jgi:hypothetical protein